MSNHRHPGKYISKTPKGRTVYKKRPKHRHTLKKEQRKIFQRLDQEPIEYGGYMDFNDDGFERADLFKGEEGSVDITITQDSEVDWHGHTKSNNKLLDKLNHFPSKEDIMSSKELPSQTMLIFHEGEVTIAHKRDDFNPKEKDVDKIDRGLLKDGKTMTVNQLFKKYKGKYKNIGVDLTHIDKKGDIKIPFSVVEPVRATMKSGKKGWFDKDESGEFTQGSMSNQEVRDAEMDKLGQPRFDPIDEPLERERRENELNDPRFADRSVVEGFFDNKNW